MRNTATADARRPGGAVWTVWVPRQYGKYSECGVPTCCATGGHSNSLRMTGEGLTFRERLLHRIRCPKCDADLAAGLHSTEWSPSPYASSRGTGTAWPWLQGPVDTFEPLLRSSTAWPRCTRSPPWSSIWWKTYSSSTVSPWWHQRRVQRNLTQRGSEGTFNIPQYISMLTSDSLRQHEKHGYSRRSTSWRSCLDGLGSSPIW